MFKLLGLAAALVVGSTTANAALYTDSNPDLNWLVPGEVVQGTFNIAAEGYNPANEKIDWATASFSFLDTDKHRSRVDIDLGGHDWKGAFTAWLPIVISGNVIGNLLVDLGVDGILSYTVSNIGKTGYFYLGAALTASTSAVPDGATTISLLGASLLAVALIRRKVQAA